MPRSGIVGSSMLLGRGGTFALTAVGSLHAVVFAACAWVLPWSQLTSFSLGAGLLAALHALVVVAALLRLRFLVPWWRWAAVASLAFVVWQAVAVGWSAVYVAELYGALGRGVAVAMMAALSCAVLFTVPYAVWGLVVCGPPGNRLTRNAAMAAVLLTVAGGVPWHAKAAARAQHVPSIAPEAFQRALSERLVGDGVFDANTASVAIGDEDWLDDESPALNTGLRASLAVAAVIQCDSEVDEVPLTAWVAAAGATAQCVQGEFEAVVDRIADIVVELRGRDTHAPVVVDLVQGRQQLAYRGPLVTELSLRPGLDGLCVGRRCLAPWQLIAADQYRSTKPIPAIHDLKIGVDFAALRRKLGVGVSMVREGNADERLYDDLWRVPTRTIVVDRLGRIAEWTRAKEPARPVNARNLAWALRAAEDHIVAAQDGRGPFRYTLEPHTGRSRKQATNLPRQAGTTLAFCELARDRGRAALVARRSLRYMANFEIDAGEHALLTTRQSASTGGLGSTALPMIAFMACRELVGDANDRIIGRLANFLLAMQRADGGFHPRMRIADGRPMPGPEPLYAVGQAVYALTLLEAASKSGAGQEAGWPELARLTDAVERAMEHVAEDYWDHPMSDFFFIEENWHCLAARASLGHHRHDGYERFCLDYVSFKRRLILDESAGVRFDFVGGYGFGNIVPPHNTGSAGFLEAFSAAMALKKARGLSIAEDRELAMTVLGFLLRQQWNPNNCLGCRSGLPVIGGFSESMSSPVIRIDYVQHAWAGIGHTARVFGLLEASVSDAA